MFATLSVNGGVSWLLVPPLSSCISPPQVAYNFGMLIYLLKGSLVHLPVSLLSSNYEHVYVDLYIVQYLVAFDETRQYHSAANVSCYRLACGMTQSVIQDVGFETALCCLRWSVRQGKFLKLFFV